MHDWRKDYRTSRDPSGKTLKEFAPTVGSRFRLCPGATAWWEVKELKERGAVIELWSTNGHKELWEWDQIVYPV